MPKLLNYYELGIKFCAGCWGHEREQDNQETESGFFSSSSLHSSGEDRYETNYPLVI